MAKVTNEDIVGAAQRVIAAEDALQKAQQEYTDLVVRARKERGSGDLAVEGNPLWNPLRGPVGASPRYYRPRSPGEGRG